MKSEKEVRIMNYRSKRTSENMAVALFAGLIIMFLSSLLISEIKFPSAELRMLVYILFSVVYLLLPSFIFYAMQKSVGFAPMQVKNSETGNVKYNVMLTFIGFVLVFVFGVLYAMAFPNAAGEGYNGEGIIYILLTLISSCFIPAVMEEYLYRGLFCRELTICGNGFAIIVSALIFGLVHFSFSVFPYAFVSGLIIGYVYLSTGSLKYTMAIHFLNNFLSYVFSILYFYVSKNIYSAILLIFIVVLCVSAMIVLYFLVPNGKVLSRGSGNVSASAFLTFPMIIFIICAIIMNILYDGI